MTGVDWFRLLADLLRAGKYRAIVSRDTGIANSTLRGWWLHECEPRHWHGEILIDYWCQVMQKGRDSVPRRRR
jgi:hypothetical protein